MWWPLSMNWTDDSWESLLTLPFSLCLSLSLLYWSAAVFRCEKNETESLIKKTHSCSKFTFSLLEQRAACWSLCCPTCFTCLQKTVKKRQLFKSEQDAPVGSDPVCWVCHLWEKFFCNKENLELAEVNNRRNKVFISCSRRLVLYYDGYIYCILCVCVRYTLGMNEYAYFIVFYSTRN